MSKIFKIADTFRQKLAQESKPDKDLKPLSVLLGCLRAASHIHQTHHWQTSGDYSDHLLFQRLYEESQGFIDDVAERVIGAANADMVDAVEQVDLIGKIVHEAYKMTPGNSSDDMVQRSLVVEGMILKKVEETINELSSYESLSPGISNLLEGIADKHETFVYLLKQRAN